MPLRTDDFDYHLPPELIAARPLAERSASRMMVVDRQAGTIEHRRFSDFPEYIRPSDLVVLNDTRVVPARFFSNDGSIELVRTEALGETRWQCMVKPGKRMRVGSQVQVGTSTGTVVEICAADGTRIIEWDTPVDDERHGHLALPHYMGREDEPEDRERYQTVYARQAGAIAAPTAGLHFTPEVLGRINHAFLTLHVGIGTFRPVKAEVVSEHDMHSEKYFLSAETAAAIAAATRVVAVGTTVTRVLEHLAHTQPSGWQAASGETNIFIYPPFEFRAVGALLTNFHLPKSTLIMLVSAFAGRELTLQAYAEAVREKYRFFSYGDCMLLI